MTVHTHLTPADVEARCAQTVTSSTVAGLLDALRADSLWSVTEFSVGGQLVQANLLYHPSGEAFTMRVRRDLFSGERGDAERRGAAASFSDGGDRTASPAYPSTAGKRPSTVSGTGRTLTSALGVAEGRGGRLWQRDQRGHRACAVRTDVWGSRSLAGRDPSDMRRLIREYP